MAASLQKVAAVVSGMLVAIVLLVAVEMFSAVVHPFPDDFGNTPGEMREHVARYPHWVLAVCVPAWGIAALAGVWTTGRIGGRVSAYVTGFILFAAAVFNLAMLPYPIWFKIVVPLTVPMAAMLGSRLSIRSKAEDERA